jgi:hypothetical protein
LVRSGSGPQWFALTVSGAIFDGAEPGSGADVGERSERHPECA